MMWGPHADRVAGEGLSGHVWGGPHADGVPGARTPQALLRFPRS